MQTSEMSLQEGQISGIQGTDLTIEIVRVVDFTSQGCLGGPVGCRDHVQMDVARGNERDHVTLYVAHTPAQRQQGVDKAQVFGYEIALIALKARQVTVSVRRSR